MKGLDERGERLFFQRGSDALLADVSARFALLRASSVRRWDSGRRIDGAKREELLAEMVAVYRLAYRNELEISAL